MLYFKVTIFLWVLMFDISADWPKVQNFVPANISYLHYRTLEFVDPVKRDLSQNRRKMYLQIIVTLRYKK